jgi:hypothetical protein
VRKYGNQPTEVDGLRFDSRAEAKRYQELRLMEMAGEIIGLSVHPRYTLVDGFRTKDGRWVGKITYAADFAYTDRATGRVVVEDVKGTRSQAYAIKRKLFLYKFDRLYDFREVTAN